MGEQPWLKCAGGLTPSWWVGVRAMEDLKRAHNLAETVKLSAKHTRAEADEQKVPGRA